MDRRSAKILDRLKTVTRGCAPDMHEPDQQFAAVVVSGYHLDNAMGDEPATNCGEFTVGFVTEDRHRNRSCEWFNLADLVALARCANA